LTVSKIPKKQKWNKLKQRKAVATKSYD